VYTANFASYSKTYGTLASIVVVMLWLYLSAFAVLLGAEVDSLDQGGTNVARAAQPGHAGRTASGPQVSDPVRG
jgi:uncharacterized BrkB/YihY/UPF0761 family membrane protein